ncbi:iron-containing redox enzyme family protein [Pseudomonas moorei]|uniref:iron-containing redox enzyme family protein n=1 Tax=Pseudomonas moorei TaxID=395599 RepID=UPI00200BE2E4|nr:iron-containing redox enzyme family protein [Pseudomonas moorei]
MEFEQRSGQQLMADYYRLFLNDPAVLVNQGADLHVMRKDVERIEDEWTAAEEAKIDMRELPTTKADFLTWYLDCEKRINGDIEFFIDFMKNSATLEQVAYYICMEEMVDGSFDDLMAVVQLGMPIQCKMVAGENYWDEMGNGNFEFVHTTMFKTSSAYMRNVLAHKNITPEIPPKECLMNGNILLMWAVRREYNMRLIGAMGLVEGSAPTRFGATTQALERLNQPKYVIAYHKAHIGIDTHHSEAWLDTVLGHYAEGGTKVIQELAIGVLIRYNVAVRYYRYMYDAMRGI